MSMFLALPLLEGALWATGQYAPPSMDPGTQDIYEFDPTVGYRLRPLLKTEQRYPADSPEVIPIVANSDGFRGRREFGQADDRFRVLVVGDSFVFGQGVREDDRLTEQMERLEPRWRVDNMGMTGWGPDLMVRAIERYGGKIRPEVVVLAIYTDDFRRLVPVLRRRRLSLSEIRARWIRARRRAVSSSDDLGSAAPGAMAAANDLERSGRPEPVRSQRSVARTLLT
jgi:hypothetical protein